jgi:hypothetical protein
LSKPANLHGYWVFWMKNILIFFYLPLDSVHASMVLYTQEVREKQNKENKKHDARTRKESGGPRGDNSRTRSEPGGETKKKRR